MIVVLASYNVIYLFKQGYEGGNELLLQTKPFTKPNIIWSKIFLIVLLAVVYAIITVFVNLFVLISQKNKVVATSVVIGSFIGTFINYIFWSGVALLISAFFNKYIVFIGSLALTLILQITSVVITIQHKPINNIIKQKENIEFKPLYLYSQNDNKLTYVPKQYTVAFYDEKQVINEQTIFNNQPILGQYPNLAQFSSNIYNQYNVQQKYDIYNYINWNYLLMSFYYIYHNAQAINPYDSNWPIYITNHNTNFYLKFNNKVNYTNNLNLLNAFYLTTFGLFNNINFLNAIPTSLVNYNGAIIQYPYYNTTTRKIELSAPIQSLSQFNTIFFNESQIDLALKMQSLTYSKNIYYNSVFNSYYMDKMQYNHNHIIKNPSAVNDIYALNGSFYYYAFELIKDYFEHAHKNDVVYLKKHYADVNLKQVHAWLNLFNNDFRIVQDNSEPNFTVYKLANLDKVNEFNEITQIAILMQKDEIEKLCSKFLDATNDIENVLTPEEKDKYFAFKFFYKSSLDLIHKKNLSTLNITTMDNYYSNQILIGICVLVISLLMILIAVNIIYKKDIT